MALDLTLKETGAWDLVYGWTDERNNNIIIVATNGDEGPPVLLECEERGTYLTMVTVYQCGTT